MFVNGKQSYLSRCKIINSILQTIPLYDFLISQKVNSFELAKLSQNKLIQTSTIGYILTNRKTQTVTIADKQLKLIMIHIKYFYPLISRELLTDTFKFAETNNPKNMIRKLFSVPVNHFFSSGPNENEKRTWAA